ncbi:MAG: hypothetical protein PHI48_05260 [Bacteroidales bacterium]|nr:hypothetical protein [Bacteroidales bacterium]
MKRILFFLSFCILTLFMHANDILQQEGADQVIIQVINRTIFEQSKAKTNYGMYINRAHIGYKHSFSSKWHGVVVLDIGRPSVFGNLQVADSLGTAMNTNYDYTQGSYYSTGLKFSYLEYRPSDNLMIQAGGILQNHYITQEKFWGFRYIQETFQDLYFKTPSGDLGAIAFYSPYNWLSMDVALTNGEGFRNNQDTGSNVKYAVGTDIKPLQGVVGRIYYDHLESDRAIGKSPQQLVSLFIGYKESSKYRIGVEYNYHFNHNMIKNQDLYGTSVFGAIELATRWELYGRYDHLSSNKGNDRNKWNVNSNGQAFLSGIHYSPVKGVSVALSYKKWIGEKSSNNSNSLSLNFEYKI